jgi:hypothetical protein
VLAVFEGDVAQLVEQRTENPCVGGSIPSVTTNSLKASDDTEAFALWTPAMFTYCKVK